jgi:hypothetical protein
MAKQPGDLVVRILREIQATQADHSKKFEQIEQRLDELHEGMITSLVLQAMRTCGPTPSRRTSMT